MKCPKHLKHRPIIVVDDYEKIDACGSNDAKALSIGKAQWDNTSDDVSVKIFRKSGGKWSPQSEELPFPRVLDLAEFIIGTILGKETTLGENVIDAHSKHLVDDYINANKSMFLDKIDNIRRLL